MMHCDHKLKFRLASTVAVFLLAMLTPGVAVGGDKMAPAERVKSVPKGELKNPLAVTADIVVEGKVLYQTKTCGACHGGNGGGIHGPSLINDAWIYGSDDDTIFRLVTLGSEKMLSEGYARGEKEKHAGSMPAFGETIVDEQEIWKILAYIRSLKPGGADTKQ